ncbi:hypothetical protein HUB94_07800 [Paenibacillus cellulosilyticus]|uniref:hypothetical protein n=1 Tax=Paenibacillus cellulosilyticus TaxID=375489 RepID=UPI000D714F84|nr:hypothetical protein [Paenibacillus cellulosilyticus]QKS44325.1 hypothetical protein HUB94_07800 [Paenibacillus cellulosilyticus]
MAVCWESRAPWGKLLFERLLLLLPTADYRIEYIKVQYQPADNGGRQWGDPLEYANRLPFQWWRIRDVKIV